MYKRTLLRQGHIIGERYLIQQIIGSGGMSYVYLADDLKLTGKQWAVKECFSSPQQYSNIRDEAELLTTLGHPQLPRIVDFFPPNEQGNAYLVMDYIQGVTLERYFISHNRQLKSGFILQLADQVLDVLEYLHNHQPAIVFRDLKPSNIMLTSHLELRLIDFGIARNYKQEQVQDTVKLGTVGFAAPEQYGSSQSDARSDLYGLGALLLYLVTEGVQSEWTDDAESRIQSEFPKDKIPVLRKLLQLNPDDRYSSASEVRKALMIQDPSQVQAHRNDSQAISSDHKGTYVIAVMGASSGVGTTHTAISIVHYLARNIHTVAIVELNRHTSAFGRIQQIVEGGVKFENMKEYRFSVEGVDYYRQSTSVNIIELLGRNYNYIVLDLGSFQENDGLEEFLRADIPILVGWGSEWRMQDMEEAINSLTRHQQNKWIYCMPLAPLDAVKRLRKQIGSMKVYSLPLHMDPFDIEEETDEMLSEILAGYMPTFKKQKRFRFGVGAR